MARQYGQSGAPDAWEWESTDGPIQRIFDNPPVMPVETAALAETAEHVAASVAESSGSGGSHDVESELHSCYRHVVEATKGGFENAIAKLATTMPAPGHVGLFWDGENVRIPRGLDACEVSGKLQKEFGRYGAIDTMNFYSNPDNQSEGGRQKTIRRELETQAWCCLHCCTNGGEEDVDKTIIVDVMAFAMDGGSTIILITRDAGYSKMLSRLKNKGIRTILIYMTGGDGKKPPNSLLCAPTQAIDWNTLIQCPGGVDTAVPRHDAAVSNMSSRPRLEDSTAPGSGEQNQLGSSTDPIDSELLRAVEDYNAQRALPPSAWVKDAQFCLERCHRHHRERYKAQRDSAINAGYLERKPNTIHLEFRLTSFGRRRMQDPSQAQWRSPPWPRPSLPPRQPSSSGSWRYQ